MSYISRFHVILYCYILYTALLITCEEALEKHVVPTTPYGFKCRDPDLGGQIPVDEHKHRKFLIVGGAGAGIGNFLIFFPSAYFYAALTGREILIDNKSLLGEVCNVLVCGFPKYEEVAASLPGLFKYPSSVRLKAYDFSQHLNNQRNVTETIVHADGYKFLSGWYMNSYYNAFASHCIERITGCHHEDVACHDRHAMQRLIRGPFYFTQHLTQDSSTNYHPMQDYYENRIIGVPKNLKHALLSLQHSYAPRLDAAIHLRCQFKHFEYLVGPDDTLWPEYVKEIKTFMSSKDSMKEGYGLFKVIEEKIMSEIPNIKKNRRKLSEINYQNYVSQSYNQIRRLGINTFDSNADSRILLNSTEIDFINEHEDYDGVDDTKIYVYLASDNEIVKEAFANYFLEHANISIMRIHNSDIIVHAKNIEYLKTSGNQTGLIDLILDWYLLSLSDHIFAWRRETDLLSTFAHSAQRLSGNSELSDSGKVVGHGVGTKGFQLCFHHDKPAWRLY